MKCQPRSTGYALQFSRGIGRLWIINFNRPYLRAIEARHISNSMPLYIFRKMRVMLINMFIPPPTLNDKSTEHYLRHTFRSIELTYIFYRTLWILVQRGDKIISWLCFNHLRTLIFDLISFGTLISFFIDGQLILPAVENLLPLT